MNKFEAPKMELDYACIIPDKHPLIGALVSSYFNKPGTYFASFVFPEVGHPYLEDNNFKDDGFVSRMIGNEATILINNCMAKLLPEKIFLAGLSDLQKSYVKAYVPNNLIVEIDSIEDVNAKLGFLDKVFDGEIKCKSTEIVPALLHSKFTNAKIVVDESAEPLELEYLGKHKGLVILENENEAGDVVAINYAHSISADVILVPSIERSEIHGLQKSIYQWKREGSDKSYDKIKKKVTQRIRGISFKNYDFATFFTQGLPYGLVLGNLIPFSHVLKDLRSDYLIFNSITYEHLDVGFDSSIVFSPKVFNYEETEDVIKILKSNNYLVKTLLEDQATVKNLDNYGSYFPYDLMHICSHGGETDGYYVIEEFTDRTGAKHKVEYEEVVGFSPLNKDQVEVLSKAIFRKFDGFTWMSKELQNQNLPDYIFEDMRNELFQNDEKSRRSIRAPANYPIYTSCRITCYDSIHQGQFRTISSHGSPVVFNNTCSSWYEIAIHFIACGARVYLGTIWEIDNAVAIKSAKIFYDELFKSDGSLLMAFHKMNTLGTSGKYQNIYIYWGLHFSTLKKPAQASDQKVFDELFTAFMLWVKKYKTTQTPEVKKNCVPIIKFITREIKTNFTPDHLKRLEKQIDPGTENDLENQTEPGPSDDVKRNGVIDF